MLDLYLFSGFIYLLTIIDHNPHWPEAIPLRRITTHWECACSHYWLHCLFRCPWRYFVRSRVTVHIIVTGWDSSSPWSHASPYICLSSSGKWDDRTFSSDSQDSSKSPSHRSNWVEEMKQTAVLQTVPFITKKFCPSLCLYRHLFPALS